MSTFRPKKGDTVIVVSANWRGQEEESACGVIAVGRKWMQVSRNGVSVFSRWPVEVTEGQFDADEECYGNRKRIFSSKEALDAYRERRAAYGELWKLVRGSHMENLEATTDDVMTAIEAFRKVVA